MQFYDPCVPTIIPASAELYQIAFGGAEIFRVATSKATAQWHLCHQSWTVAEYRWFYRRDVELPSPVVADRQIEIPPFEEVA
jgi:hypothetical protein